MKCIRLYPHASTDICKNYNIYVSNVFFIYTIIHEQSLNAAFTQVKQSYDEKRQLSEGSKSVFLFFFLLFYKFIKQLKMCVKSISLIFKR